MNKLLNFYQITERVGTAGQPTVEQFEQIAILSMYAEHVLGQQP